MSNIYETWEEFHNIWGTYIMVKGSREENIRQIIDMEDRIAKCRRCKSLIKCVRKPSLGKGELDPELIMIFEYDNHFTRDVNNLIGLRNMVKKELNLDKIYHTFVTRCQPKACVARNSVSCYTDMRLLDKENRCLLNGRDCEGIPVRPADEEIIACLPFLLEEVTILKPAYVLLLGNRVAEYMLKSWGIFDIEDNKTVYTINDTCIILAPEGEQFTNDYCQQISQHIRSLAKI